MKGSMRHYLALELREARKPGYSAILRFEQGVAWPRDVDGQSGIDRLVAAYAAALG
jgi:hypothetical protein